MSIVNRNVLQLVEAVLAGFEYDPGCSDLDDVQPINVRITLGAYRKAMHLKYALGVTA